jgi:hypothetical protein
LLSDDTLVSMAVGDDMLRPVEPSSEVKRRRLRTAVLIAANGETVG